MPTINIATTSGGVSNQGTVYSTVHNATTGSAAGAYPSTGTIGQSQIGSTYRVFRGFLAFDTSTIIGVPASATINLTITLVDTAKYICVAALKPSLTTNIATTDFAAYTVGSAYTSTFTAAAGLNTITLNSIALSNMDTLTTFRVAILGLNDVNSIAPTGISETDTLGYSTGIPYISYVVGGYTKRIYSLTTMNKVDNVLKSAISKIDGV